MEMIDRTGQPRRDEEIAAALNAVDTWMAKEPAAMGPDGMPRIFNLIVIHDALKELLQIRKAIREAKKS